MDINYIIKQEPKIIDILAYAERNKKARNVWKVYAECKNNSFYMVGYGAKNINLCSSDAYDVFINELCDVLNI